jgi:4-hydroxybenzoate polyprenyltransferase
MFFSLIALLLLLPFNNGFLRLNVDSPLGKTLIRKKTTVLCQYHFNNDNPLVLQNKIDGLVNITRINDNFIPTSILVGLSGVISNGQGIMTKQFWAAFSIVHIISAASMIMNDLFDIETDRINNPERPLIQGSITQGEAEVMTTILLMLVPIIGYSSLPVSVAPYWWSALWLTFLYTPILKRWFLVKNLVCATVVSATVPFVVLSVNGQGGLWSSLTAKIIFMASFYIELLLDIVDIKGDRENGIPTVPVVLGKTATILMATSIVNAGFVNMLVELYTNRVPVYVLAGITISYSPFYLNLWRISRTQGSPSIVKNAVKQTTISMLIYFVTIIGK